VSYTSDGLLAVKILVSIGMLLAGQRVVYCTCSDNMPVQERLGLQLAAPGLAIVLVGCSSAYLLARDGPGCTVLTARFSWLQQTCLPRTVGYGLVKTAENGGVQNTTSILHPRCDLLRLQNYCITAL
jgi:hypothetical protein